MRAQEYYLMALSQPRSDYKIDDGQAGTYIAMPNGMHASSEEEGDQLQEQQPQQQHNPKLSMLRGGSLPESLRFRSTSSFIKNIVGFLAPLAARLPVMYSTR